ncbi:SDR family NAD(P)-dependent oxidoreductase [Sphingomonas prati]|uniref:3-hydroxy acid dehydrogenase/malonic semialdehyde reductase n=1 Tax=Sphingomonas prati TaxID=1843237 RepID=A0A7W9F1Q4_9SPHN|nr:SDR family NAD(P)-dependent oxidoreductase [Sphingomonas prati]MBB5729722.1 3-hydroxy acid dehydrogenase/malonic semialdehyde reductase [Sphingomonas prati]GGE89999.1 NAD(P)-dependent oxidoreductase [Sphingomonas prati]
MSRTALVTGATSGFGLEIARRLVAAGHRVIAAGRRTDRLEALRDELGAEAICPLTLDVTDAGAVAGLPGALAEGWREVDILVNNAGLALGTTAAQDSDLAQWEQMVATNVLGLMRLTHAILPGMVARGRGDIVNLGSVAANYPYPGGNVYGATKAFVQQFTLGLKTDLAGTGVRVSDVQPGLVGGTEFSHVRFGGDDAKAGAPYADTTPMTAADVAEAVLWIIGLPAHVNVNRIELMPVVQGAGPFVVKRGG